MSGFGVSLGAKLAKLKSQTPTNSSSTMEDMIPVLPVNEEEKSLIIVSPRRESSSTNNSNYPNNREVTTQLFPQQIDGNIPIINVNDNGRAGGTLGIVYVNMQQPDGSYKLLLASVPTITIGQNTIEMQPPAPIATTMSATPGLQTQPQPPTAQELVWHFIRAYRTGIFLKDFLEYFKQSPMLFISFFYYDPNHPSNNNRRGYRYVNLLAFLIFVIASSLNAESSSFGDATCHGLNIYCDSWDAIWILKVCSYSAGISILYSFILEMIALCFCTQWIQMMSHDEYSARLDAIRNPPETPCCCGLSLNSCGLTMSAVFSMVGWSVLIVAALFLNNTKYSFPFCAILFIISWILCELFHMVYVSFEFIFKYSIEVCVSPT